MPYLIHALHFVWGTVYPIPIFFSCSLEKLLQILFWGWQLKARRTAAFLSWYFWTSLPEDKFDFTLYARTRCHFLFHKHVFVVFLLIGFKPKKKKKKNSREKMRNFYFFILIAFQILYMFLPDISAHCALIEYAYIWLRVYVWYLLSFPIASLMIDSYFPHAMKMCTIQGSPKVHHFPLWLPAFENSNERDVFDKMVKLTNMLVEPRA